MPVPVIGACQSKDHILEFVPEVPADLCVTAALLFTSLVSAELVIKKVPFLLFDLFLS